MTDPHGTTDYTALIERLEGSIHGEMYVRDLRMDAASALRSLVAERDDYRSNADRALEVIKQFHDERDALRQRLEAAEKDAERYRGIRDNIGATDERIDALLLKYPLDAAYRGEHKP
jgi:uncharacterized coiled-coil DUF342 family protein